MLGVVIVEATMLIWEDVSLKGLHRESEGGKTRGKSRNVTEKNQPFECQFKVVTTKSNKTIHLLLQNDKKE